MIRRVLPSGVVEQRVQRRLLDDVKAFFKGQFDLLRAYIDRASARDLNVVVQNQKDYSKQIDEVSKKDFKVIVQNFKDYSGQVKDLQERLNEINSQLGELSKRDLAKDFTNSLVEVRKELNKVETAVKSLKFPETKFETKDLLSQLEKVEEAVLGIEIPETKIEEPKKVIEELKRIQGTIKAIKFPAFPKQKEPDLKSIVVALAKVQKAVENVPEPKEIEFPASFAVNNFPPQKIPQPVTNISINPLRGYVHTTNQTITTSRSTIPSYGVLDNRRSLIVYNNSSTVTVFLGGTGVTSSNGVPLPPKSYSPSFDAGIRMILYGITGSSSANIRVMELSNDASGG